MNLIKCKNLSIGYENKKILDNINFEINENDYFIIVGENGSGKTTLVKTLLGLTKPIKGKISFSLKRNEIGYLPQNNTNKNDFPASVYEVVISGCLNSKKIFSFYTKQDKELVNENLKRFKIENIKNKNFKELSGGERQKVLLARAMCASSKILILDEPNISLDNKSNQELYKMIHKLNQENITIIMISHDTDKSLNYANKVLEIKDKKISIKTKEEYLKKECNHGCNN